MARAPQHDLGKRMMNQALIVLVMIGIIIYFLYSGNVLPDDPVTLEVTTEQSAATAADAPIPFLVTVVLSNNTKEGMALTIPSECDSFDWFVTGTDNEFVQSEKEADDCPKQTVSTWLDGGKAMKETFTLPLDPRRVHPGDYILHMRYWGHETTKPIKIN
jgi:hypothetical protein